VLCTRTRGLGNLGNPGKGELKASKETRSLAPWRLMERDFSNLHMGPIGMRVSNRDSGVLVG
jgi:hypothetical protein